MPYFAGISTHPDWREATAELAGQAIEKIGFCPDFCILGITEPFARYAEAIAQTIDETLAPGVMIGGVAQGIIGGSLEVRAEPAINLMAGSTGPVIAVDLNMLDQNGEAESYWNTVASSWVYALGARPTALVALADKSRFPLERFLRWLGKRFPGIEVAGGRLGLKDDASLLLFGRQVFSSGATGLLFGGTALEQVTCQGVRPIGDPLVVTGSERSVIKEIAGLRAMDCLISLAQRRFSYQDVKIINEGGLHLGKLVNERADSPRPEDFAIAPVMGAVPQAGAIAAGEEFEVGEVIQFYVKDAKLAARTLKRMLKGKRPEAVMMFLSEGRGLSMHLKAGLESRIVAQRTGNVPMTGFVTTREICMLSSRPHTNALSASLALLGRREGKVRQ